MPSARRGTPVGVKVEEAALPDGLGGFAMNVDTSRHTWPSFYPRKREAHFDTACKCGLFPCETCGGSPNPRAHSGIALRFAALAAIPSSSASSSASVKTRRASMILHPAFADHCANQRSA